MPERIASSLQFWRKALDKSFDRKDDNGVFAITSGSTIKLVSLLLPFKQLVLPLHNAFEYAAAAILSFQQPPILVRVRADTVWTEDPTQAGL